ncbi:MAG: DUF3300 domain-containing protein [Steroidobacteraceae bacterium]|nr:DUF3300 domain-containing protein [Steroidobacteraceae bacterium]
MRIRKRFAALLLACPLAFGIAPAAQAEAQADSFSTEQLEQIVAPIALYPDSLLTQILMASTYPLEIVEAQRWRSKNAKLEGDALDAAMKEFDWDPSVKSLAHLPDVLKRMNDNLDWTQDLGDAFLAQKTELMDTVQRMRGKAKEAGNLKTTEQQVVKQNPDQIIIIESSSPEVIYVPSYSPTVVYGGWGYSSWYYPPMYPYYPPGAGLVAFGIGVAVGGAIWGNCNWGWGNTDINIDIDRYNNFNRNTNINPERNQINKADRGGNKSGWSHDPSHRKGVNYKNPNVASQYGARGGSSRVSQNDARGWSQGSASNRAAGGAQAGTRDLGGGDRGAAAGQRDFGSSQHSPSASTRQSGSRDSAYSGSRSSSMDRAASSRGASSRSMPSYGGAGMRGGGGGRRR